MMKLPIKCLLLLFVFVLNQPKTANAYSVLTHEALIDASWQKQILPLLKLKYPKATDAELKIAHGYTYGGCLLPDMGYFPFGSTYFTNLSHYVRSGDFVENLLAEAKNLNEYAFAVGTLCHYMADKYGHSIATNHTVPIVYPKMKKKFGNVVTYDEDNISHSRVEIAFDVLQIARGNYASPAYHDFIGFEVAKPVLERAFLRTYGQDINDVFGNLDLAISTYRWSVKSLLPSVTRTAWNLKKDDIKKLDSSANSRKFHFKMKRKAYYKEFGSARQKPKFGDWLLGIFIQIVPKIGPFKALKFKDVGPEGEKLFIRSFDTALTHYAGALHQLHTQKIDLTDIDYDTGKPTVAGEYGLADITYSELLDNLGDTKFNNLTSTLKQNILNFYSKADTATFAQKHPKEWKRTSVNLHAIKLAPAVPTDSLKTIKGIYYKLNEPADMPVGGQ